MNPFPCSRMMWLVAVALPLAIGCKAKRLSEACEVAFASQNLTRLDDPLTSFDPNGWRQAKGDCQAVVDEAPTSEHAVVAKEHILAIDAAFKKLGEINAKNAALEAESRKASLFLAARKVKVESWGTEPDGMCAAKGLPPFKKSYEGGTIAEDEMVAVADGCQRLFERRGGDPTPNDMIFCCPRDRKGR